MVRFIFGTTTDTGYKLDVVSIPGWFDSYLSILISKSKIIRLNSRMVRFIFTEGSKVQYKQGPQFQDGSIHICTSVSGDDSDTEVSIPRWFDSSI